VARKGAAGPKASTLLLAKKAARAKVLMSLMILGVVLFGQDLL
jgi:hypothetical protein